ncbi:MAG: tRNA lysidine(34) synthetase TilS [Chloroflexales bacterium]|nr:tRNA lysidine(34) synthetase TilS [Chloroflexales bacterium]
MNTHHLVNHLQQHSALASFGRAVVAVSGGPDSLALLYALREIYPASSLVVYHLDHQFRGAQSAADAQFVANTAQSLGLTAWIDAADIRSETPNIANLSEAARVVRYRRLAHYALQIDADMVLVAHTQDDQAETVLMRLLRGSGTTGLAAMRAVTPWSIWAASEPPGHATLVRPLLAVTRATILDYCATRQLAPRHDPSNEKQSALRVRVRHNILPALRHEQPQLDQLLAQTALLSSDSDDFVHTSLMAHWDELAQASATHIEFQRAYFCSLHPTLQRAALRRAITLYHGTLREISFGHIEGLRTALITGTPSSQPLPFGIPIHITTTTLTIGAATPPMTPVYVGQPQLLVPPQTIACGDFSLLVADAHPPAQPALHDDWHVFLQPNHQYTLRTRRAGDRIGIGNGNHRRVQDVMVDAKIPASLRDHWPVICVEEQVVWIAGVRCDPAYRATVNQPALHFWCPKDDKFTV